MIDGNGIDRLIGAGAGALIAVLFIPPKSWNEAIRRLAVGTISGIIFMLPFRDWLMNWPDTVEYMVASACFVALAAWWILGAIPKAIDIWVAARAKK